MHTLAGQSYMRKRRTPLSKSFAFFQFYRIELFSRHFKSNERAGPETNLIFGLKQKLRKNVKPMQPTLHQPNIKINPINVWIFHIV